MKPKAEIWARLRVRVRQTEWKDVLTFLFFVALATALWFGHAMQSVRNARVTVPIHYAGIPQDAYFDHDRLPAALKIEVRDAGKRLRMYQVNPPELTIDLSSQMQSESGTVRISSDVLRRSLTDLLQGTSKLVSAEPEQISVEYVRQKEKTVPVLLRSEFVPATEYQLVGEPQVLQQETKVYGTEEQLASLRAIATEDRLLTDLRDTVILVLALQAPEGIRLTQDSVQVQVITERYTEKPFRLPIVPEEVREEERLRVFPQEVSVTVRIGLSRFSEVTEEDFTVTCPYPTATDNKLPIRVECRSPYVTNLRFFPQEAEFIVER
ncbi:MAG: hypothetical protein ACI4BD_00055 [Paludibacteraceae bacterium]